MNSQQGFFKIANLLACVLACYIQTVKYLTERMEPKSKKSPTKASGVPADIRRAPIDDKVSLK